MARIYLVDKNRDLFRIIDYKSIASGKLARSTYHLTYIDFIDTFIQVGGI
jgi:hypothetical protein